jgi:aminoglycoside phosphotransferase family enzyme/predicted kinase
MMPWAQVKETHTGAVFLVGERVYKIKKPVDLGFCDFTTVQAREAVCRREVELNRRLAPDVYLGVAELHLPDRGQPEPVVVMLRLPEETRLAARVAESSVGADEIRAIARLLAEFHDRCDSGTAIAADATAEAVWARWAANLDELEPFVGSLLDRQELDAVARAAREWIAGREALFDARIADGRIVDGHGDLLADDIFLLPDGPRVLDCLEFDDRLRHVDRIDDVAFLAMDLERLGAVDLADALVAAYRQYSGDEAPDSLLHHYIAYRALVRAKVAFHRHRQGDAQSAATAHDLLRIVRRHLASSASRLILVGGLPGTGKSTVSDAVAEHLGAVVIATDRVRKELAGLAPEQSAAAEFGAGLYTPERTDETYREVLRRAARLLRSGETVVLDATWSAQRHRDAAAELAARTHNTVISLVCVAPAEVAAARMVGRVGPSDANASVAAAMRDRADPWPDATAVDTSGSLEQTCRAAVAAIEEAVLTPEGMCARI